MVTVKQLLQGKKYKFKHLTIEVIEKDEADKVHVFSAVYVQTGLPGKASPGLIEVNQLWDQNSGKRPPGYIVCGAYTKDGGLAKSVLVSEEFYVKNRSLLDELKLKWAGGFEKVR